VAPAIVEAVRPSGVVEARTIWQADDIDGITRIVPGAQSADRGPSSDRIHALCAEPSALCAGSLVDVVIEGVIDDYDFDASLVRVVSRPLGKSVRSRELPVMSSSVGSYGR
jgi:hypothetical protein